MSLPKFLQPYLASYDLSKLDKNSWQVRREIITQLLNMGDDKAILWLFQNFSTDEIKKAISNPDRGIWFKESLNYWEKILGVKTSLNKRREAVLNINPT